MYSSLKDLILLLLIYWCSLNGNCLYKSVSILLKGNELTSTELYDIAKYCARDPRLKDERFLNQNIAFCVFQSYEGSYHFKGDRRE